MRYCLYIILLISTCTASGQNNIAIGQWRSHQDFGSSMQVAQLGDTMYCATATGLFYVIRSTGVVIPQSKINGFSDINIKSMGCSQKYHSIFLGYQNTTIDILHNGRITQMKDIYQNSNASGARAINGFFFNDKFCYIATTFGIIKYDMELNETREDYPEIWPGEPTNPASAGSVVNISSIAFYNDSIYAATDRGLIAAKLSV